MEQFSASLEGCCFAAEPSGYAQGDQQAIDAAKTFAQQTKPSYKTLKDFIADYERGRGQLDGALTKICARMNDHAFNSPLPYLNNQTRLQYRDGLLNRIAEYDSRIEQSA